MKCPPPSSKRGLQIAGYGPRGNAGASGSSRPILYTGLTIRYEAGSSYPGGYKESNHDFGAHWRSGTQAE